MKLKASTSSLGIVALAALLWSAPAQAQTERPWSFSFDLGGQAAVSGDAHGGASGSVLGLPTSVTAKTYGDVFGTGFYWGAGIGYHVSPRGEIRVSGSYTSNPSDELQVGTVAGLQLLAKFDDYKAFGMDFGYRQYLSDGAFRPFVGAGVGFARVSEINSTLSVPAAGVTLRDVPFYASSTVPTFGVGGGAQVAVTDAVAFQVGVDFRWSGDLKQSEGLSGTGLETINDESRRWALPVTAGITIRF
jgi:opacity protein-like surface antigen